VESHSLYQHRIIDRRSVVSQDGNRHHKPNQHGTYKPELLAGLPLLMGGKCMEMRVQGLGVYAVVLADSEFQKVGDEELAKGRIIKSPGGMPGFLLGRLWWDVG
jgi:hypothetical protein